jgi:hypothetical protein
MTKEQYEDEAQKIASEGLDYYLTSYGAHTDDPELQKLYEEAKAALDKIEDYFKSKGVDLSEY